MTSQLPAKSDTQHDYILLDSSSSMTSDWFNSLTAIDAYIAGVKAEAIHSQVILHMFYANNIDYIHRNLPIGEWTPLGLGAPEPYGSTPLYDAVNFMGRRLREINPPRASIVIVTDGEDSGGGTSVHQARTILDWCRAKGWQITFIGCDFSNSAMAGLLGAAKTEAIGVASQHLTDAAKALAKKRGNYGRTGAPMHWTESEQQQFGGYLAPPRS